ncbi:hypothetical protein Ancab_002882 [Ancistrocladus abbreviatus]
MSLIASQLVNGRDVIVVQYVESSMSTQLLCKFPDKSVFDFDYSQSALWSPLVRRYQSLSYCDEYAGKPTPKTPKMKRKLPFDNDDQKPIFNGFSLSKIKKKIAMLSLTLNFRTSLKFKSHSADLTRTPSSRKGWGKTLKATSTKFKKKKDGTMHVKLSDFLRSKDL